MPFIDITSSLQTIIDITSVAISTACVFPLFRKVSAPPITIIALTMLSHAALRVLLSNSTVVVFTRARQNWAQRLFAPTNNNAPRLRHRDMLVEALSTEWTALSNAIGVAGLRTLLHALDDLELQLSRLGINVTTYTVADEPSETPVITRRTGNICHRIEPGHQLYDVVSLAYARFCSLSAGNIAVAEPDF